MQLVKEFRDFALKGNVVDMAVGIIIGGAFGKIVSSLVNDVMMPLLGALGGVGSFGDQFLWLGADPKPATLAAAKATGQPYLAWGAFLQTTIDFLIVAAAIFLLIKGINQARSLMREPPAAVPDAPPPEDIRLLREIRDALLQR